MGQEPHSISREQEALDYAQQTVEGVLPYEETWHFIATAYIGLYEQLEACREEGVRLAMDETASSMAAQGKRVWEPAQSEAAKRIVQLENAIRRELGMTHGDDTIRRLRAALEPNPAMQPDLHSGDSIQVSGEKL